MPSIANGELEVEVASASFTSHYRQGSSTSLASSTAMPDIMVKEPVDIDDEAAASKPRNEMEDAVAANRSGSDTSEVVASLEKAFTSEEPNVSVKVTPTPPKEAPPMSVIDAHADEDKFSLTSQSKPLFRFDTFRDFEMIKEQNGLLIAKNALTHFTKATVGGGMSTLLTLGSIFKATTSANVASSAKAASSSLSEAVKSVFDTSDDKSVADVAKDIGTVAAAIGAVGSAFLRSFIFAAVSSDVAEAGTDATKEFALLLASLAAIGLKQGERVEYTLTKTL
jgi:hypothetical protein